MFLNHFRKTVQSIKQTSIFHVLSSAVRQFIMTKSFIDKQHEFSLFMLDDDAQLVSITECFKLEIHNLISFLAKAGTEARLAI